MPEAPKTVLDARAIALASIQPSATNPRKSANAATLAELTASIKIEGVLCPILVRPHPKDKGVRPELFEIVCGERRYKAATAAGLKVIPAVVRAMTDLEVCTAQIIENSQREDVLPLEEAAGFENLRKLRLVANIDRVPLNALEEANALCALLDEGDYPDAAALATSIGKSERYVFQRIQLARDLCDEGKAHLLAGTLTPSHAELLVRLKADEQSTMTARAVGGAWSVRKLKAEIEKAQAPDESSAEPDEVPPVEPPDDPTDPMFDDYDEGEPVDQLPVDDAVRDQVRAENKAAKRAEHQAAEAEDDAAALSMEDVKVERAQRQAVLKALAWQAGPVLLDDEKDLAIWMVHLHYCMGIVNELHAALEAVGWSDVIGPDAFMQCQFDRILEQNNAATLRQFIRCMVWAKDCSDWHAKSRIDEYLTRAAKRHGVDMDEARKSVL